MDGFSWVFIMTHEDIYLKKWSLSISTLLDMHFFELEASCGFHFKKAAFPFQRGLPWPPTPMQHGPTQIKYLMAIEDLNKLANIPVLFSSKDAKSAKDTHLNS